MLIAPLTQIPPYFLLILILLSAQMVGHVEAAIIYTMQIPLSLLVLDIASIHQQAHTLIRVNHILCNLGIGLANASNKGLMSAAHYTKLEGIAPGANNYTHPSQTAIDTNATDDGISVIDRVTVNTLGHVTAVTTRNLAAATTSTPGHMTAAQASKLAGIDDNANNYSHPTGGANVNISASTIETIASVVVNTLGHTTAFTKQTIRSASTSQTGIVELATDAEMKAGSSGTLVGTAASVKAAIDFFATLPVYANLTAANTDAPNQPTGKLALVIV
jgi:hypothetical protein